MRLSTGASSGNEASATARSAAAPSQRGGGALGAKAFHVFIVTNALGRGRIEVRRGRALDLGRGFGHRGRFTGLGSALVDSRLKFIAFRRASSAADST